MKRLFSARALPAIVLSVAMCVRAQTQTNDAAAAAEPSWWSGIWAAGRVNADNDAPINVGQLKHVASRALAWLETRRITEAEEPAAYAALGVFSGMVAGWTPGPAADNAAPVPVGALKETAAKFHDVLAALGYPLVTGETVGDVMETEEGLTNPPRYPWGAAGTLEELQAPANFLTRQLTAAGAPPRWVPPTTYTTATSGTGAQTSDFVIPAKGGRIPYFDAVANAGGRVFFWPLPEPRPGMLRPEDTVLSGRVTDGVFWYREKEEAGGFLKRGIVAVDEEVPASVIGVGSVKSAAGHPVAIRHFLHEFTTPSPGSPAANQYVAPPLPESSQLKVPGYEVEEEVIGYLAEAVTAGPGDVVMPGTNGMPITVPEDRAVAFEHDAAPLQTVGVPGARPVVRGRLIPESVSAVASNPQAADADGDGFTAGEEMRMGSSDGDAAVPGGVRPFLASALAGLGPHVIHDERDAARPVGDELWGRQTVVAIPVAAGATKRYMSLVVTHRGFPRGTQSAVSDTLAWSLTGAGASLGGMVKASDLHHVWLSSMAGGRTLGGARPSWVIPLGFVADGGATAGVTVTTASARGEWLVAAVLTDDSQALAGVGGRFVAAGVGVPENHLRINDRPAAIPFGSRPQISGNSTASGPGAGFDSDEDFSPDLEEQAAGTNPQDKHSAPVVLSSLVLTREAKRYRPNPNGWSGYTELNVNDGWAVFTPPAASAVGVAQLGRTYQTSLIPGTQFNTWDFSEAEYRGDPSGLANDFVSLWEKLGKPTVPRGLPADNGGSDGLDAAWSLYVPEPERRVSATTVPFRGEYLATTGMRYRLRGPLSDAVFGTQSMDLQDLTPNGWDPRRLRFKETDLAGRVNQGRWFHSDIKNVSYFFNYKVFEKMVDKGNLKN